MPITINRRPTISPPLTADERLELAKQLYQEYHTRCFWHCPRDLDITEDMIPLVIKGLRAHGGRRGFILASYLLAKAVDAQASREFAPCR